MARFARGGFVWGSTGISSQKVYYYHYEDKGFLEKFPKSGEFFKIFETLLLDQKK